MGSLRARCGSAVRFWYLTQPPSPPPRTHSPGFARVWGFEPTPGPAARAAWAMGVRCSEQGGLGGAGPCFHAGFTPFPLSARAVCAPVTDPAGHAAHPLRGRWGAPEPGPPPVPQAGPVLGCGAPRQMLMSAGGTALEQRGAGRIYVLRTQCLGTRPWGRQPPTGPGGGLLSPGCAFPGWAGWPRAAWCAMLATSGLFVGCHLLEVGVRLGSQVGIVPGRGGKKDWLPAWGCKSLSIATLASKITSSLVNVERSPLQLSSPLGCRAWSAVAHPVGCLCRRGHQEAPRREEQGWFSWRWQPRLGACRRHRAFWVQLCRSCIISA